MWSVMVYINIRGTILTLFCIFTFCAEDYTLEVAGCQSWPNFIGPKRGKGQVCLTRQCLHPFTSRWRGLESPLLRIDNSGWSVNSSTLFDVAGMRWYQRKYHVLYIIRQPIINSIY